MPDSRWKSKSWKKRRRPQGDFLRGVLREGVAVRYAWIDGARDTYPLVVLCRVLSVSTSGFADWKSCDGPSQWLSDEPLLALIRSIHIEVKGCYGSPRMLEELKSRGFPTSKGRVRRLMQAHGIRARHKRRYKATTNSKHKLPVAQNLLNREFDRASPNQVWTVDITYIPTGEGWLYLAVVMDLYSRMIVGWAMSERMTRELAMDALRMAKFRRKPAPGLLHHSDRGSQYCSGDYQALLTEYGMCCSMSRKGSCWDNAPKLTLVFAQDVASSSLWFQHTGQDLQISVAGSKELTTLKNWYAQTPEQVYKIVAGDSKTLSNGNLEKLVQAMAAFASAGAGSTSFTPAEQQALQPVLAANWH